MKYENPTCEIVLLDDADCIRTSSQVYDYDEYDTPFIVYPNY